MVSPSDLKNKTQTQNTWFSQLIELLCELHMRNASPDAKTAPLNATVESNSSIFSHFQIHEFQLFRCKDLHSSQVVIVVNSVDQVLTKAERNILKIYRHHNISKCNINNAMDCYKSGIIIDYFKHHAFMFCMLIL